MRGGTSPKREASPSVDAPDVSGKMASFSVDGRGSRVLPRSSWRVHRYCRRSAFAVDNLTVESRVA